MQVQIILERLIQINQDKRAKELLVKKSSRIVKLDIQTIFTRNLPDQRKKWLNLVKQILLYSKCLHKIF